MSDLDDMLSRLVYAATVKEGTRSRDNTHVDAVKAEVCQYVEQLVVALDVVFESLDGWKPDALKAYGLDVAFERICAAIAKAEG